MRRGSYVSCPFPERIRFTFSHRDNTPREQSFPWELFSIEQTLRADLSFLFHVQVFILNRLEKKLYQPHRQLVNIILFKI